MTSALGITDRDLLDAARLLGHVFETFSTREFAEMVRVQAHGLEEDQANDKLLEFVAAGDLREVGPGVYSFWNDGVPLQHPIFAEDARP